MTFRGSLSTTNILYTFFSMNQITFDKAHCSYFFSGFQAFICFYFVLVTTVNSRKGDNGWRIRDPYFWCESTKFPKVARNNPFFPYLWNPFFGIHAFIHY